MVRGLIFAAITASSALTDIIPASRWIQAGSVDESPDRPFGVIRVSDGPPSISRAIQTNMSIWIHDDRGSYVRIDSIIELVKSALAAAVPMEDSVHRIVDVRWNGDSSDSVDEGYNTNVRTTSFTMTGRK